MSFKHNPVYKKDVTVVVRSFQHLRLDRRGSRSLLRQQVPQKGAGTCVFGGV